MTDPSLDLRHVAGIVFDLDGTLVDSYGAIAESLNHARGGWGLAPLDTEFVRRQVGRGLESLIAEHVGPDRVDEGVRRFRERYAQVYAEGTHALPGALPALRALHDAGYVMSVASNKPARFSGPILEALGMRSFFRCVEGPDLAGTTKPEPTMIHRCLRQMGVTPDEGLYVGDMVLDVESGDRAGVPVLLVAGGSSSEEELASTGRPVVASLGQLAAALPRAAAG